VGICMEVMSASLTTSGSRLLQADRRQAAVNKIKSLQFISKKVVRYFAS